MKEIEFLLLAKKFQICLIFTERRSIITVIVMTEMDKTRNG